MWGKRPATICLASIAKYLGNKHKGALLTSSLTKNISILGPACSFDLTLQQMYRFESTLQLLKEVCLLVRLSDHIMIDIYQIITITITSPLDSSLRTSS